MKRRWCTTLWPTEALAAAGGHGAAASSGPSCARGAVPRPARPDRSRGAAARLPGRADRAAGAGARDPHRGRGHRPAPRRRASRTWVNSDGKRNMPSGEVFTGPHEDSADGRVRFTVRSAPAGVDVDGVELELRDGEVVGARAARGEEYLERALADRRRRAAPGRARASARTSASTGRSARSSSTRRSAGPSTSRSAARTRRPAGRNARALHWDLICDLRDGGRLSRTASRCCATAASSRPERRTRTMSAHFAPACGSIQPASGGSERRSR